MSTVTLNGSRLNDSDSSTGWSNLGGGGPSPASEAQLRYQGASAVNRKVTTTASRTGVAYTHGTGQDMTGAAFPLWLVKAKVADAGDLNTTYGVEVVIGSGSGAFYSYNVSGSGANNDQFTAGYNSQGGLAEGYVILALNPNIAQWREGTTGSPNLASVTYFGVAAQFVVGGAKSENVALDAIDIGVGLDYNGSSFTFGDAVTTDQNNTSNRWAFACANGPVIFLRGFHRLATTAATTGTDTRTVLFPDGYQGTGNTGISVSLSNASTAVNLNGIYTGLGRIYSSDDTRPDFTVTGTSGTLGIGGDLVNFRNVTLTSGVTVTGLIEAADITQGSATFTDCEIQCDAASGVAVINDATFANMSGVTFKENNAGHAIEITSPGSYTFDSLFFTGFGGSAGSNGTPSSGATNAAIYNNSGGAVTINITNGGDTPSVRNGASATTTVNNTVSVTVTVTDTNGSPLQNARVYVVAAAGGDLTAGTEIMTGLTNASGVYEITNFSYTNPQPLTGRVRLSSTAPFYKTGAIAGSILSAGFATTVQLVLDQ